jgi:hypothetical protein
MKLSQKMYMFTFKNVNGLKNFNIKFEIVNSLKSLNSEPGN